MRDVFSNETLKEINDLIDEIIENLDDNVETVENPPAVSRENGIASIFTATNYDGTQRVFSASDTTIHILLDGNEDAGKSQRRSLKFTIGDKSGVAFEKNDDDTQYYIWWESDFGIDQQNDGCLRFRFDGYYGTDDTYPVKAYYTYEMTGLTAGKTYTITFTGGFGTTTPENFNLGGALIVSELVGQTMTTIAQEDFDSDAQTHSYSVTFTPTGTEVYLKFDFTNVIKTSEPHTLVFAVDEFTYTGLDLGVTGAYVWLDGWHLISTGGGGTSDLDAIELTYAEYQALTPAEKTDPDKIYFITDYPSGSGVVINPTGTATDTAETIEVDGTIYDFMDADAVHTADIGVAGGVAELDANGKVPSSQLPSYVDDVVEYASISAFPATGESGKIYIALDTNKTYRWTGSVYVEISPSLALGETSSTAYRGDRGKTAYDHSQSDHSGIAPAFTEASTRANIASGETFATLLGKIKKFFSDLKAVAFSGSYNDLTGKPTKLSDFTDDVVSGNYYPISGGNINGNVIISSKRGSWQEGLRILPAETGYRGILFSGSSATSQKEDKLFWIGGNPTLSGKERRLWVAHNGSTDSDTYFGVDSANQVTPYLNLGVSGSITSGDTKAVTGGAVYNALPKNTSDLTNDSNFVSGSYSGFAKRLSLDFGISGSSMQGKWYTVLSKRYNYSLSQELIIHISNLNYSHSNGTSKMFVVHSHYRNLTIHPIGADPSYVSWMVDWRTTYDSSNIYLEFKVKLDIGADSANQFRISYITLTDNTSFTVPTSLVESSGRTVIDTYTLDANFRTLTPNDNIASATKATKDGDGNTISSTYMKVSTQPTQIFNKIPTDSAVTSTISSIANYKFLIFNITSNAYKSINWGSYIIPVAIVSSHYGSSYNGIIVRSMLNTSQYVEIAFLSATSVSIKGTNWQNSERVICYAY